MALTNYWWSGTGPTLVTAKGTVGHKEAFGTSGDYTSYATSIRVTIGSNTPSSIAIADTGDGQYATLNSTITTTVDAASGATLKVEMLYNTTVLLMVSSTLPYTVTAGSQVIKLIYGNGYDGSSGSIQYYFDWSGSTNPDFQLNSTITYSVAYDANGGTGTAPATQSGALSYTVSANTFSRSGYSFNGWNTLANGTGTNYAVGSTITPSANTTLYAKWIQTSPASVTVSPTSVTLLPQTSQQLTVTVLPAETINKSVTYSSSNEAIAIVSTTGLISSIAVGTATITVTTVDGGVTTTCLVTVVPRMHIYYGGTTGATDGTLEVPGDGVGVNVGIGGSVAQFHMRCETGYKNAVSLTVNAPSYCQVSKDGVAYADTVTYASGDITDINKPCYIKRTESSDVIATGLYTTPRLSVTMTGAQYAFTDMFNTLDTDRWSITLTSPATETILNGRLLLNATTTSQSCYISTKQSVPLVSSHVYRLTAKLISHVSQYIWISTDGQAYISLDPSGGIALAIYKTSGWVYVTSSGTWSSTGQTAITLSNMTTTDYQYIFETNSINGVRYKILSSDGATSYITSVWIPWSDFTSPETKQIGTMIGTGYNSTMYSQLSATQFSIEKG